MSARSLRALPAVETLLQRDPLVSALKELPRSLVLEAVRAELSRCRSELRRGLAVAVDPDRMAQRAAARARADRRPQLTRVLNASGVVLHTNLGRSPLSEPACRAIQEVARGYSSLEIDLASGRRGERS